MKKIAYILSVILALPVLAFAQEGGIDTGDTAWMIVATAMVMIMTPAGLALFYAGMTRSKNVLNTIGMSFFTYAVAAVLWVVILYSISFGTSVGGFFGNPAEAFMLKGIGVDSVSGTIPTYIFVAFQMTFAGITAALVSGSVIERMKFSTWLIFIVFWLILVYAPICHWVWGGGFIGGMGALDFAGGTVVHINAGVAGLVLALALGKRRDYGKAIFPSSITLTVLGAAMLWFGWFGFNAGSELAADGIAASAFLVTNTSAAAGVIGWVILERMFAGKITLLGGASGAIAGLVAITPAAGFVGPGASIIMGLAAGGLGFFGVFVLKNKLGYDDSLDAFGVHGLCGFWGAIATGIFANPAINEAGVGLLYGNAGQVVTQFLASIITLVYTAVLTYIIYKVSAALTGGGRVIEDDERVGLDEATHGEKAFNL